MGGKKAKPWRMRRVWRHVLRFMPNELKWSNHVMALKAFCVATHHKMRNAKRGNSVISSLGTFLFRFGLRKTRANALAEYSSLMKNYKRFYRYGMGKYLMQQLD